MQVYIYVHIRAISVVMLHLSLWLHISVVDQRSSARSSGEGGLTEDIKGTWACAFSSRGFDTLKKTQVLELLTREVGPAYKVDISKAEHTFLVEVNPVRLFTLLSASPCSPKGLISLLLCRKYSPICACIQMVKYRMPHRA